MNTLKSNLDETDWSILRELQENARLSYSEIGRRVGLSTPAVQERIRKLEEAGVIEGYHAQVNYRKLGLPILAVSQLRNIPDKEEKRRLTELIKASPEVIYSVHVTGQDDFIIIVVAESVEHLESIIKRFTDHCQSISSIVTASVIKRRSIDLDNFPYLAKEQDL